MSLIVFFVVLSILILIHEFGHFWTAKRFGVWVEEFGLGIPPKAWGKKIGETIYSVNWLPFGGFVRLHGEDPDTKLLKPERAFINKSKRKRSLIVVAGVIMNFLLSVVCFAFVYSVNGVPAETENVKVVEIVPDTPAEEAGIVAGDTISQVNGVLITSTKGFIDSINTAGKEAELGILRGDELLSVVVFPRENPPEGQGSIGVVISTAGTYYPPLWQRPFYGIYYGFKEAIFWGEMVIVGFITIFSSIFSGKTPEGIAGPVGIYAITSQAASYGIIPLINFIGILSINLAILNILPFPALDGGRLLFIIIEAIWGRRVLPKFETYIHMAGMAFLILLIIFITFGDIVRLSESGWDVQGFLESFAGTGQ